MKGKLGTAQRFALEKLAPKEEFMLITLTLERLLVSILFLVESGGPTEIPTIKL